MAKAQISHFLLTQLLPLDRSNKNDFIKCVFKAITRPWKPFILKGGFENKVSFTFEKQCNTFLCQTQKLGKVLTLFKMLLEINKVRQLLFVFLFYFILIYYKYIYIFACGNIW